MNHLLRRMILGATRMLGVALALGCLATAAFAQYLVVGIDNKVTYDASGKQVISPPGNDAVVIVDIKSREHPKIAASFPLMNSILGPPTNLAITPDESLALVASSVSYAKEGEAWKTAPDDKLYVIDLKASPIAQIGTLTVGKQPSGLAINKAGTLALVANRADNTVSVLTINGKDVKVTGTVGPFGAGDEVSAVAITPDGKRALVARYKANKLSVLDIEGTTVTYNKQDVPTNVLPYNVQITPNGQLAMATAGSPDGHVDAMPIYDLMAKPIRLIGHVTVGDGPEGFVISPDGRLALPILIQGSNADHGAWFYHRNAAVAVLTIKGKTVAKVGQFEVGALAEGVAFSPDGKYFYVSNYLDNDLWTYKVQGTKFTRIGVALKLPGHPASMRGNTP